MPLLNVPGVTLDFYKQIRGVKDRFFIENDLKPGINVYGYFNNVFGIAESARAFYNALLISKIPFCLVPIVSRIHERFEFCDTLAWEMKGYFTRSTPFSTNLILTNADQLASLYRKFGNGRFKDRYNIGVWAWELEDYFPFDDGFAFVDELWLYSDFIYESIKKHTSKPIRKITYPFVPSWGRLEDRSTTRRKYGLDDGSFVFFYNFDFYSSMERKNPDGAIDAFREAFPDKRDNVRLVLKTLHADRHPGERNLLKRKIGKDTRIIWIDKAMSRDHLTSLVNASDCYISLHRSEGLGLGMMEAMYLGKCTIGTAYGGNLDFMDNSNSLLVDYSKTEIKEDFGPYKKGKIWAEPSIDKAIKCMKSAYQDSDMVRRIGEKAAEAIRFRMDPEKTAGEILEWAPCKK
jgi:glycosyltransferase involved in cell wall biosynthesis